MNSLQKEIRKFDLSTVSVAAAKEDAPVSVAAAAEEDAPVSVAAGRAPAAPLEVPMYRFIRISTSNSHQEAGEKARVSSLVLQDLAVA